MRVGVTDTILFARSIGGAIGVTIFGAIANSILEPMDAADLAPAAVTTGSTTVFLAVLVVAVATVAATAAMPKTSITAPDPSPATASH